MATIIQTIEPIISTQNAPARMIHGATPKPKNPTASTATNTTTAQPSTPRHDTRRPNVSMRTPFPYACSTLRSQANEHGGTSTDLTRSVICRHVIRQAMQLTQRHDA
jgi:hypothetical protein